MLISEPLAGGLREQVGREFAASQQYLALATYLDAQYLPRLAEFYYRQADEERGHGLKIVRFLVMAGAPVKVPAVPAPRHEFASVEEGVELSLEAERQVTRQFDEHVETARQAKDHQGEEFLRWFVTEQLEEVTTFEELLSVVRRAGPDGLLLVEQWLASRPAPHAEG
jgi:ferritin